MTVYGNINANMDAWFESIFYAQNYELSSCSDSSYDMITNQIRKNQKNKTIDTPISLDINGNYSVKIPLVYPKKDKCDFQLMEVKIKVRKKYFKNSKEGSEFIIYAPNSHENYLITKYGYKSSEHIINIGKPTDNFIEEMKEISPINILENLPKNIYYVLAQENRYECQYWDNHDIGTGTSIDCIMKVLKGEIGRTKPIKSDITIKIDIFLNDADRDGNRYNPDDGKKEINFFSKFINGIFGD